MSWSDSYVGVKFVDHGREGGFDCWGLARKALAEQKQILLPSYGEGYRSCKDYDGISRSIVAGLAKDFIEVDSPKPFDLVIFKIGGKPLHVGLMVTASQFLHADEPDWKGQGGYSRLEYVTDIRWEKRFEGYYRHASQF